MSFQKRIESYKKIISFFRMRYLILINKQNKGKNKRVKLDSNIKMRFY